MTRPRAVTALVFLLGVIFTSADDVNPQSRDSRVVGYLGVERPVYGECFYSQGNPEETDIGTPILSSAPGTEGMPCCLLRSYPMDLIQMPPESFVRNLTALTCPELLSYELRPANAPSLEEIERLFDEAPSPHQASCIVMHRYLLHPRSPELQLFVLRALFHGRFHDFDRNNGLVPSVSVRSALRRDPVFIQLSTMASIVVGRFACMQDTFDLLTATGTWSEYRGNVAGWERTSYRQLVPMHSFHNIWTPWKFPEGALSLPHVRSDQPPFTWDSREMRTWFDGTWIHDKDARQFYYRTSGGRIMHNTFDPSPFLRAVADAGRPVWVHIMGDSRARYLLMQLVNDITGRESSTDTRDHGPLAVRLANPWESGCWSRLCTMGEARRRFNLTYAECVSHFAEPKDLVLPNYTMPGNYSVPKSEMPVSQKVHFMHEWVCAYFIDVKAGGGSESPVASRLVVTFEHVKTYQFPSVGDRGYLSRLLRTPHFRPDVLLYGPTHDVLQAYHNCSSARLAPEDPTACLARVVAGLDEFLRELERWHCEVSPNTKIVLFDNDYSHMHHYLSFGGIVADSVRSKAAGSACHEMKGAPADQMWYFPLPAFELQATLPPFHLNQQFPDPRHFKPDVIGAVLWNIMMSVLPPYIA